MPGIVSNLEIRDISLLRLELENQIWSFLYYDAQMASLPPFLPYSLPSLLSPFSPSFFPSKEGLTMCLRLALNS